ncbi:uncharacterized protein L969DRAFT_15376 [Mixia osmundae IAM 14324]|uniref:Rhamnolipids biosynthesis 3-oxoacyl-[acyl-carrier-protein] reductase n=1 Tax=Mixia osmundae (strain CBS 9802 / IAM 14324 / JCM 22182 / KY 12970) TaxID=764103 RepID=G7DXZ6_MIXOS|nr:uncharacterized protein L969DRAFT_15376 [Mixia osmundae IAM 14324]KEI41356.1 hypothetical protein L969DRAFT_15376 [Mixia osmundae IAM 14324]GAA95456.1 hypothetical protein E5Q_02110 [Mixia osmundae IAM 14324]
MSSLAITSLFSVNGKNALVTGGGSGLGAMMAAALVQNSANVIIASRKEKQLKEVSDKLNAAGPGKCSYIVADISSKAGCDALCDAVKQKIDKLHILVNNSGVTWGAPYADFPEQGWTKVMNVNVNSLFFVTAGLTELLAKDADNINPGRVINIASVAARDARTEDTGLSDPGVGLWSYNTSKAAAVHLTSQLCVTLSKRYITVNAILPGVYPSKMTAHGLSKHEEALAKGHPMGRIGTAEDMAGLLLFLCSRAGAHVSGESIATDGGATVAGAGCFTKL